MAAATAAAAAATDEEAESLAMAAADALITAAAEGPRGGAKLARGTRNMAEKWRAYSGEMWRRGESELCSSWSH